MSAFKDAVQSDIKGVFINLDEFAELYSINGEEVMAVVDQDILKERPGLTTSVDAENIYEELIHIYIEKSDLQRKPVKGEILRLNETIFLVHEVADNMGVLEITIRANET